PAQLSDELDDLEAPETDGLPPEVSWYLNRISNALPDEDHEAFEQHPKIEATVKRALELWRAREKVLIFCFYIATGRALRRHIAQAIEREIVAMAAAKLHFPADNEAAVHKELDRLRERLYALDSPSRRDATNELRLCLGQS